MRKNHHQATDWHPKSELEKYTRVYSEVPGYHQPGSARMEQTIADMKKIPSRGSLLDVGCGHGKMMVTAELLGFHPVKGCDFVEQLCDGERVIRAEVTELPFEDKSFDVVCMFDVIEHIPKGQDEIALLELYRVAKNHILLSASNRKSIYFGVDLHINKREYSEWENIFRSTMPGKLVRMPGDHVSPMWRVDL